MNPLDEFLAVAPPIDDFREEAARCCEETARYERGEREALRLDPNDIANNEFSDSAAGIAAEVATTVSAALKSARISVALGHRHRNAAQKSLLVTYRADQIWEMAAMLLRSNWERGDRLVPMVTRGEPS